MAPTCIEGIRPLYKILFSIQPYLLKSLGKFQTLLWINVDWILTATPAAWHKDPGPPIKDQLLGMHLSHQATWLLSEIESVSHLVMSDSLWTQGL